MKRLFLFILIGFSFQNIFSQSFNIQGELKKWHKITLEFDGPFMKEDTIGINPFADFKFDVTFTNGSKTYIVPGYFAADGNAAETSSTSGNKWHVHFSPDTIGTWNFLTSFYTGTDIAINGQTGTSGIIHNISGNFTVSNTDKIGRDHRGKGRLSYVDEHYLRFQEDSTWFFKAGADAPENTLAYEDFDEVPNRGSRRKSWQPHQQDYDSLDGSNYTWKNGKGTELLGVIRYLSSKGVNAFSFLTLSLHGDDENVFPYLLKVPVSIYNTYNDANQWNLGVHHDRFDVSRLAQWEKVFEYADKKGMYMHFKTMETENDNIMDSDTFGRERKLYYRELIARFSHHLALNWNLTEESTLTDVVSIATTNYIASIDPYGHNIVLHTYPGQQTQRYTPLLGSNSSLTGASIQIDKSSVHNEIVEWVEKSALAGKKWVVANDEQGSANIGVDADPNDIKLVREEVLWGTLMAGGGGVEYYYGYQTNGTDLNAQDHRTRDLKYTEASYAIQFFNNHIQSFLPSVISDDPLTADVNDYVLKNNINMVTVYRPNGGTTPIILDPTKTWTTNWYNPRTGIMNYTNTTVTNSITAPDSDDWVALITTQCPPAGTICDDGNPTTTNDSLTINCVCIGDPCPALGTPCDDGNPTTINDQQDGSCNCLGVSMIFNSSPLLEAEDAVYGSMWTLVSDTIACNGAYLLPPNNTSLTVVPSTAADLVSFQFDVDVSGIYKIYARTWTTNDGDDSFWVRANGGTWQKWNKINSPLYPSGYQWSQVGNWTSGETPVLVTFNLNQGSNTVDFAWREPNARLDKIFITNEDISILNMVRINTTENEYSFPYTVEEACPYDTIKFENNTNGNLISGGFQGIVIDKPLVILGNGINNTILDGNNQYQFFTNNNQSLFIHNLTFQNAFSPSNGGAFLNNGNIFFKNIFFQGNFEGTTAKSFTNFGTIEIENGSQTEVKE